MMLSNIFKKFNMPEYDKVKVINFYDAENSPFHVPTAIIFVDNNEPTLLIKEIKKEKNDFISYALTLNNTPLVQYHIDPEKKSINTIATGYGIDKDIFEEFQEVEDSLNYNYMGIKEGIDSILPILNKLKTGIYAIADIAHYPTDGNGNFFWDVSNKFTEDKAMSEYYTKAGAHLNGFPSFLYPSHDTALYDEDFVKDCCNAIRDGNEFHGVAFYLGCYTSLLLKGHNIACASALSHKPINCLTIMTATSYITDEPQEESENIQKETDLYPELLPIPNEGFEDSVDDTIEVLYDEANDDPNTSSFNADDINDIGNDKNEPSIEIIHRIEQISFGEVSIPGEMFTIEQLEKFKKSFPNDVLTLSMECDLISRVWPKIYSDTVVFFPTLSEVAETLPYNIYNVNTDDMTKWTLNDDYYSLLKLNRSLSFLVRKNPKAAKNLALQIAQNFNKYVLTKFDLIAGAFDTLDQIEGDPDIDDFFVNFLLIFGDDDRYKNTVLEEIITRHWNKKTFIERENSYENDIKEDDDKTFSNVIPEIGFHIIKEELNINNNKKSKAI